MKRLEAILERLKTDPSIILNGAGGRVKRGAVAEAFSLCLEKTGKMPVLPHGVLITLRVMIANKN